MRSIHVWPESWLRRDDCAAGAPSGPECAAFASRWVRSHAAACARAPLRMPLLVTEFGLADAACRAGFFDAVYSRVEQALGIAWQREDDGAPPSFLDDDDDEGACGAAALAGSCFWMLAHEGYPNADGTNVTVAVPCAGGGGREEGEQNAAVLRLVARHAARVRAWNEPAGRAQDAL